MVTVKLQTKWWELEKQLNIRFLEREPEIQGLMLAALSKQHIEFIGPPGNAKSAMLTAFAQSLQLNKQFDMLLTKFSNPDEMFGPIDLPALKLGHYKRVLTDKLPEAEVAYLDEVYKANSAMLNSLLRILQERKYNNNGQLVDCPLLFCAAASNEFPDKDEGLAALHDRFLLRYAPEYIQADDNFLSMLQDDWGEQELVLITKAELSQAHQQISKLEVGHDTLRSLLLVRTGLRDEGLVFSDRRYKQSLKVMAAWAWLHGLQAVDSSCITVLEHILWEKPEQQRIVAQVVRKSIDPEAARIAEIVDAASSTVRGAMLDASMAQQAVLSLSNQVREMRDELSGLPPSSRRDTAVKTLDGLLDQLLAKLVGRIK